jgi:anti-sigma-K factor RskA
LKQDDFDKRLSAYIDGALTVAKREKLERELESDAALQKQLRRSKALASLVREAWTEGPAAPTPEFLIAAIRPDLAAISRARRARPEWQQTLEQLRLRVASWWSPVPLATSALAAFLLAVAFLPRPEGPLQDLVASSAPFISTGSEVTPAASRTNAMPTSRSRARLPSNFFAPASLDRSAEVYDVSPGEGPALLLQNPDGSTLLWLFESDDLSQLLERMDQWG